MSVLITAASTAKAYQLKNTLNSTDIIMGDHEDLPEFMLQSARMIRLPQPASASYTHQMLTLCLDKQIDKVYVLRPEEAEVILKAEQLFNEYGIEIVCM